MFLSANEASIITPIILNQSRRRYIFCLVTYACILVYVLVQDWIKLVKLQIMLMESWYKNDDITMKLAQFEYENFQFYAPLVQQI